MNRTDDVHVEAGVASLPAPERLLVWAIRAWAGHHADLSPVWWSLDRAFSRIHAPTALPHFHQMMAAIFAGLTHWPDIRSVACPRLGAEEVQLLQLLRAAPCGDQLGAHAALRSWVARPAVRVICLEARSCVAVLMSAGIRLSPAADPSAPRR